MFETLIGNSQAKAHLKHMVESQSAGNSLLFAGPDGVGKACFAEQLAERLLGKPHHPDLHHLRPEGKSGMHSIATLREFSAKVALAPFQGTWKVFIIHAAERMLPTSSNALLKTFEEPPSDTLIILISSQPEALLPTILSRCRVVRFGAIDAEEIADYLMRQHIAADDARRFALQAQGSLGQALALSKGHTHQACDQLLRFLSRGAVAHYKEIVDMAEHLAALVDEDKQEVEGVLLAENSHLEGMTAVQKESLQKEVDGYLAMRQLRAAQELFNVVLEWYRDLQLLRINGDRRFLKHSFYEAELEQAYQRGESLPFDDVERAVSDTRIALERSTQLTICLETLFLRLNRI